MSDTTDESPEATVENNPAARRFEAHVGADVAFLTYRVQNDGTLTLLHTEVPAALRGGGIGASLAHAALEHARAQNRRVIVRCPFVSKYIERHPEYAPLVLPHDKPSG